MIAFLTGILTHIHTNQVILDVNGVGYLVRISNHTLDRLPTIGEESKLFIYHHISDNDQQLYGFAVNEEKNLFELLITVKSIGPRLALALLSFLPPSQIINAIINQNAALLAKSQGIGKKSAERIVLELRDKLGEIASVDTNTYESGSIQYETISALEALGYGHNQAYKAVQTTMQQETTAQNVSDMLKQALKYLQS